MTKPTFSRVPVKPAKRALFIPTTMSVAMAAAGVIPGTHLTKMMANTAVVRHRNDNRNQRSSVTISL